MEQVTAGGVNPLLLDEIRLNVEALRQVLLTDKARRFSLPLAVYEDAERFLQKLQRTPQILAAFPPAGKAGEAQSAAPAGAKNNGAGERSADKAYGAQPVSK